MLKKNKLKNAKIDKFIKLKNFKTSLFSNGINIKNY